MKLEEFAKVLEAAGYPVAFYEFTQNHPAGSIPFICYLPITTDGVAADDVVYFSQSGIQVELYTEDKDPAAEANVENVLADFVFSKDEGKIDTENLYMVKYQMFI